MKRKIRSGKYNAFGGVCLLLVAVMLLSSGPLSCSREESGKCLKIGLPEEPKTLNVWLASDANSKKIISLIYQPLYRRNPETMEMMPWLAADAPVFDKETRSYTVRLKHARWSDGTLFTARDVVFTRNLFMQFKVPRYYSRWKTVKDITVKDRHTVVFYLKKPSAIFLSRILTAPMVSEKEWGDVAERALKTEKPLGTLRNHKVDNPLGTGPFVLDTYKKGAFVYMKQNPYFFGRGRQVAGKTLGPHVDSLLFKIYNTSDVAVLALKKGDIDMFWWEVQPGYVADLKKQDNVAVFRNKKSAMYFMGFNVRKSPFDDRILRQATATLIDKEFILSRILQKYGTPMHAHIPSGNRFWYNPDVKRYGAGMTEEERIKAARQMLRKAGYSWETDPVRPDGTVVRGEGIRLPDGTPMEKFVILTPPADYDPKRAFAGMMIQEWLRDIGMPVFSRPMSFNSLIDTVKGKRDFDAFVLGYGRLNLDPDYLRAFYHSENDKPWGWNMSGYENTRFDKLAEKQISVVDVEKRKKMIFEMQEILKEDIPYLPLYTPDILEAVYTERYTGWIESVNGIGSIWSLCMVRERS